MDIITWIGNIIILCPWILWGFLFVLLKKIRYTKPYALFFAADVTTFFLLFSIKKLVLLFFDYDLGVLVLIGAVLLAILFVVFEWIKVDDVEIRRLIKKVWRLLFVILTSVYIVVVIVFVVREIINLFT